MSMLTKEIGRDYCDSAEEESMALEEEEMEKAAR